MQLIILQLISFLVVFGCFSAGSTYGYQEQAESKLKANLVQRDLSLPLLERFKRSTINLNIYYHPENAYACYSFDSPLYCTTKRFTLQVKTTATVSMLKQLIESEENYPAHLQVAKYGNKILQDGHTLGYYNIPGNALIDLTLREIPQ